MLYYVIVQCTLCLIFPKERKGMSHLLQRTCEEAREGNSSIKQQVRDLGNKFLNSVHTVVLQLPVRKSSREVIFINTRSPEERVQHLIAMDEIQEMDDDADEVHSIERMHVTSSNSKIQK